MNHAISGEILAKESRFPRSEIFFANLVSGGCLEGIFGISEWYEGVGCLDVSEGQVKNISSQDRPSQDRSSRDRFGLVKLDQVNYRQVKSGRVKSRQVQSRQGMSGQVKLGQVQ